MSWFLPTIVCILGWGFADLFYKKASNGDDRFSHWKIAVWVGLVMGICALVLLPFSESGFSPSALIHSAVLYAPASFCYIISMIIGYAGLRYLELSVASPVQNASGAFSAICILVFYLCTGNIAAVTESLSVLDLVGTVLIVCGTVALAVAENRLSKGEQALPAKQRRYRYGAVALLFPVLYCVFDTMGTAADGIILDKNAGMGLGEFDVLILYGLTFFLIGIGAWIYLLLRTKKPYNPFTKSEAPKAIAALCEEFGQVFYVFAMAAKPVLAAPMVASYCVISVFLSRVVIHERLKPSQRACVITVICGILLLGISEGLGAV